MYYVLLREGVPLTVKEILDFSSRDDISFSTKKVYSVLNSLVEKGVASKTVDHPTRYFATNPSSLAPILHQEIQSLQLEAEGVEKQVQDIYQLKSSFTKSFVYSIREEHQIWDFLASAIRDAKPSRRSRIISICTIPALCSDLSRRYLEGDEIGTTGFASYVRAIIDTLRDRKLFVHYIVDIDRMAREPELFGGPENIARYLDNLEHAIDLLKPRVKVAFGTKVAGHVAEVHLTDKIASFLYTDPSTNEILSKDFGHRADPESGANMLFVIRSERVAQSLHEYYFDTLFLSLDNDIKEEIIRVRALLK